MGLVSVDPKTPCDRMSFRHAIDHDHRVITIAFYGEVDGDDLMGAVRRMTDLSQKHPIFQHVWDGMEIEMLDVDYKSLLALVAFIKKEMEPQLRNCPGAAVLLRRHVDYVLIKTIHLMIGAPEPMVILRDREAAKQWLQRMSPSA